MSSYRAPAFNPVSALVQEATWLDNYFGPHSYGVQFDGDGKTYHTHEVSLEAAAKEIERLRCVAVTAECICAKLEHPIGNVTALDKEELRIALDALFVRLS